MWKLEHVCDFQYQLCDDIQLKRPMCYDTFRIGLDTWYDSKISTKDLPEEAENTFPMFVVPKPHKNEKNG